MEPTELKEKFISLRAKGHSFDRIAKKLGKSKQTLVNWSRDLDEEIANLKSIELEALNEQFYLSKRRKIEVLGRILKKLKTEIDKRDLTEVSTDKLMDLFLKYYALLEDEWVEPVFRSEAEIREAKADKEALDRLVGASRVETAELKVARKWTGEP